MTVTPGAARLRAHKAGRSIAAGDLNIDGILDVVTTDMLDDQLRVYLGNGDGSFKAENAWSTDLMPACVELGDLNNDGILDLLHGSSSGIKIQLGNGNGTFKSAVLYTPYGVAQDLALSDVNGDGLLDIFSANSNGNCVSRFLANGDGTFTAGATFATGSSTRGVALGDLNGDGVLDLAAANRTSNNVSTLLAITRDGVSPLLPFSLKTKASALQALPMLKQALNNLSGQRGTIGANQSRISTAAGKSPGVARKL